MMQKIWRGIELSFQNWHKEFDEFWRKHSKVSKSCALIGTFWAKYILLELKWYIGVIFHDTEEWCKIWKKKPDLWFGKWYEEFGKFLPEHSKVSKLERWWDPFIQSKKCMSLKFTKESCVMTVKNDAKNMERNWLAVSKLTWGIWRIFDPSNRKSQKLAL